ncbi:MAG: beta-phosphoglucomutase family hydrolase [Candidatus Omnitrophica bacterium]|nr:beta-phosphoglucomutase family hydrolase [Candidatus Omnitrophota bacterium]
MFKTAIFDLDGVIVNTVSFHFGAWKRMFSEYGADFTFEDYKEKVDGIPRYNGAKAILTDLDDAAIEEAGDKKQEYFLQLLDQEDIPVYESSVRLIKELREHGRKIAVASSSKNCKRILERTGTIELTDAIVDGNSLTKGKPDPQIFLMAAQKLSSAPNESIVFEDAVLGVEAAKNAEMLCVGIDRYKSPERLNKADLVVPDLAEVDYKTLEGLFNR